MNRLLSIGFRRAGSWEITDDGRLRHRLDEHARLPNCLYAFIADGEVLYVGKTTATLVGRMNGYAAPGSAKTTNARSNQRIRLLLAEGKAVEIYALPDEGLVSFGPFNLNLAAALEDSIIRIMEPPWNGGRTEQQSALAAKEPPDVPAAEDLSDDGGAGTPEIRVTLQPTYARSGYFNLGVAGTDLLGDDGQVLEVFLGYAAQPILASINRRANTNGSPRIMGGKGLRDWLAANIPPMAQFVVRVLGPTAIRIMRAEAEG